MLVLLYCILVVLIMSIIHMWIDHFKAPRLGMVYTDSRELPLLSVLVPARNEENNIANCLESLIKQDYPNYEIIIIDDGSTDKTFDIAEAYANKLPNIKVIKCPEKPPGWLGKSYALHHGVSHAKGSYFAFIDADVTLSSQILSKTMWFMLENKAAMISLLPTLLNETFWENVVQPVMGFMIVLNHPHHLVNNPASSRVVANGQYILFEREAYFKIGGHEVIKSELVEDVELARTVKKHKLPYRIVLALDDMKTHMYHNLGEIWRGWGKSIYPYIKASPLKLWLGLLLLFVIYFLPFITVFPVAYYFFRDFNTTTVSPHLFHMFLLNLIIITGFIINKAFVRKAMHQKMIYAIFFPVGFFILFSLFFKRTIDYIKKTGVVWKDRVYQ